MTNQFDEVLAALKEKVVTMGSLAEAAVHRAIRALVDRNDEIARSAKDEDRKIDQLEIQIDELAIALLAKAHLPGDLRLITIAMKISRDLERVGDEATTISRRALELNQEPLLKPYITIPHMAELALQLLKESLDAFVARDSARARAVIPRDREVDAFNKQLNRELISYMIESPATITRCLNLMVVSKSLERIADHATNIAEQVVYLYEGHDIRHTGKGQANRNRTAHETENLNRG